MLQGCFGHWGIYLYKLYHQATLHSKIQASEPQDSEEDFSIFLRISMVQTQNQLGG